MLQAVVTKLELQNQLNNTYHTQSIVSWWKSGSTFAVSFNLLLNVDQSKLNYTI